MEKYLGEAFERWGKSRKILANPKFEDVSKALSDAQDELNYAVNNVQIFDQAVIEYRAERESDIALFRSVSEIVKFVLIAGAGVVSGGSALAIALVAGVAELGTQAAEIHMLGTPKGYNIGRVGIETVKGAIGSLAPGLSDKILNMLVSRTASLGITKEFAA